MQEHAWIQSFPASITVCDPEGIILEMNEASAREFAEYGGMTLLGSNLLECHPEPSRTKLKGMLAAQQRNVYTIEKKGAHKLVYQAPWYHEGEYGGFIEMILPMPAEAPHFNRD